MASRAGAAGAARGARRAGRGRGVDAADEHRDRQRRVGDRGARARAGHDGRRGGGVRGARPEHRRGTELKQTLDAAQATGLHPAALDPSVERYLLIAQSASNHGYSVTFLVVALLGAIGAVTVAWLVRKPAGPPPDDAAVCPFRTGGRRPPGEPLARPPPCSGRNRRRRAGPAGLRQRRRRRRRGMAAARPQDHGPGRPGRRLGHHRPRDGEGDRGPQRDRQVGPGLQRLWRRRHARPGAARLQALRRGQPDDGHGPGHARGDRDQPGAARRLRHDADRRAHLRARGDRGQGGFADPRPQAAWWPR